MFIIRAAFWLLVVAVLIPTGRPAEQNVTQTTTQQISAHDALYAAYTTAGDVSTFCSRNPDVCATGALALGVLEHRARNGLRTMYDWAASAAGQGPEAGNDATASRIHTGSTRKVANNGTRSQNTLRIDDIIPEWSGPDSTGERA